MERFMWPTQTQTYKLRKWMCLQFLLAIGSKQKTGTVMSSTRTHRCRKKKVEGDRRRRRADISLLALQTTRCAPSFVSEIFSAAVDWWWVCGGREESSGARPAIVCGETERRKNLWIIGDGVGERRSYGVYWQCDCVVLGEAEGGKAQKARRKP
jgi:hypothetical protein